MQSCGFSGFGADRARLIRRAESEKSPREVRTQRSVQRRAALNHRKTGTKKRQRERERERERERGGGGHGRRADCVDTKQHVINISAMRCDASRKCAADCPASAGREEGAIRGRGTRGDGGGGGGAAVMAMATW